VFQEQRLSKRKSKYTKDKFQLDSCISLSILILVFCRHVCWASYIFLEVFLFKLPFTLLFALFVDTLFSFFLAAHFLLRLCAATTEMKDTVGFDLTTATRCAASLLFRFCTINIILNILLQIFVVQLLLKGLFI
jgi:hypothetical protein